MEKEPTKDDVIRELGNIIEELETDISTLKSMRVDYSTPDVAQLDHKVELIDKYIALTRSQRGTYIELFEAILKDG